MTRRLLLIVATTAALFGTSPRGKTLASAVPQGLQKITQGDCARITGDGLHQQARRAILGILRQVDAEWVVTLWTP
jgi:hypothetical protein